MLKNLGRVLPDETRPGRSRGAAGRPARRDRHLVLSAGPGAITDGLCHIQQNHCATTTLISMEQSRP